MSQRFERTDDRLPNRPGFRWERTLHDRVAFSFIYLSSTKATDVFSPDRNPLRTDEIPLPQGVWIGLKTQFTQTVVLSFEHDPRQALRNLGTLTVELGD